MGKLGVKANLPIEENKRIIAQAWLKDPYGTEKRVRYLMAVWKPSGNYEKARELWEWFKRATPSELRDYAGVGDGKQKDLFSFA